MLSCRFWLIGLIVLKYVSAVNPCDYHATCSSCIRDPQQCKWCSADYFNSTRCIPVQNYTECRSLENPQSSLNITSDTPQISRSEDKGKSNIVQIRPQQFNIKLRPGQKVNFTFNFKRAEDYPADLYFLLDASISMNAVRNSITEASKDIYEAMQMKTKNVFIGLGSFIDKNAVPFIIGGNKTYSISSYHHLLSLTDNYEVFKQTIKNMTLLGNTDEPEGGFDALAQAMVCGDKIGWREQSRKIIIYITDALFHAAGDGITAGITQPYDGGCYMDEKGKYTKELEMDYPSVGMIRKLATKNHMTIIFFVDKSLEDHYTKLTGSIKGSRHNHFDGSNEHRVFEEGIQKTLSDIYEEITQTIKIKDNMRAVDSANLIITYSPDCTSKQNEEYLSESCQVENKGNRSITTTVHLLKPLGKDRLTVELAIESINERVTLDIEVLDCDCGVNTERDSKYCEGQGTKICGICDCNPNWIGERCECEQSNHNLAQHDGCKAPGSKVPCSGRGVCSSCGVCTECSPGFEGKFCQCNQNSCPKNCRVCDCGQCRQCMDPWTGDQCDCYEGSRCVEVDGRECSGRGVCKCSSCDCAQIDSSWDARLSQDKTTCAVLDCADCHARQCALLAPCAACQYDKIKYNRHNQCPSCSKIIVEKQPDNITDIKTCLDVPLPNDVGCYIEFRYRYRVGDYGIEVFVKESDGNCLESHYVYGGIVLGTILLVGILTLITWKYLTDKRDRKEYERFLEEYKGGNHAVCENPIYEPACTSFNNPAFRKVSDS